MTEAEFLKAAATYIGAVTGLVLAMTKLRKERRIDTLIKRQQKEDRD